MRRGFTFVELMFASAITVIVFAAIIFTFFGVWRLSNLAVSELQMALLARNVRERLIFHLGRAEDGSEYDGLYTAKNVKTTAKSSVGLEADFVQNVIDHSEGQVGGVQSQSQGRKTLDVLSAFPDFAAMARKGAIDIKTDVCDVYGSKLVYVYLTLRQGEGVHATEYHERFAISEMSTQQGDLPPDGEGGNGIFDSQEGGCFEYSL